MLYLVKRKLQNFRYVDTKVIFGYNFTSSPKQKMVAGPEKLREYSSEKASDAPVVERPDFVKLPGDIEGAINAMGHVSERGGENAKDGDLGSGGSAQATGKKSTKAEDDHQIRIQRLLENAPAPREMLRQIHREIQREVEDLHKQAQKMSKASKVNYHEMNNTVKRIRELKGLLKALVKASLEGIKTLWLRFVHGIM